MEIKRASKGMSVGAMKETAVRERREVSATSEQVLLGDILKEVRVANLIQRGALEAQAASTETILIPEAERPRDRAGWIDLTRKQVEKLRDLGESPYSPYRWDERPEMKRVLGSIREESFRGLRDELIAEVWAMQKEDKLNSQWKGVSNRLDDLATLLDIAPKANILITPDYLDAVSNLPEAKVPVWLEKIIPESDRSMSVQISRGVYVYAKFFGEWAECMAEKLDEEPGGIEDWGKAEWKKGNFGIDKKNWLGKVNGKLGNIDWSQEVKMLKLNKEVLEQLGFGSDGVIQTEILRQIFENPPEEIASNEEYKRIKEKVNGLEDTGGMSLFELLKVGRDKEGKEEEKSVNVFCQNVNKEQVDYTRWLTGVLAGSEYAEKSALRFMTYTGEIGRMNTTAVPVAFRNDVFYQLAWPDRRRMSEARKRRRAGPLVTLGRYKKSLCLSWMEDAEIKKTSITELIREGKWFHTLSWQKLGEGTYVGNLLLNLMHTVNAQKAIVNEDFELNAGKDGLLSGGGTLKAINKAFQFAFLEWEEEGGFKRREKWAREALVLMENKRYGELAKDKQGWSPWVTFIFGLIYEHHPDRKLPLNELQSPNGIRMNKQIEHSRRWHKKAQVAEHGELYNLNSVADLLSKCREIDFLTPTEKILVGEMCQL